MNHREAAIAALLRQGWVATSVPVAPSYEVTNDPITGAQQQQQQEVYELPASADDEQSPESTSNAAEASSHSLPPSPSPSNPAQDLSSGFTLIDLADDAASFESVSTAPTEASTQVSAVVLSSLEPLFIDPIPKLEELQIPTFSTSPPPAVTQVIPKSQEDWILCSEVGLQFMRPARENFTCLSCNEDCDAGSNSAEVIFRSMFWKAATCHAGHKQGVRHVTAATAATGNTNSNSNNSERGRAPGLCKRCDKDYVLKIVRGEQACCHEGCRRVLQIRENVIRDALWDHPGLLHAFFALVQKHNVYECAIHADDVSYDASPASKAPLTDGCDHDRNACNPCLTLMCEAAIQGNRLNDLVCPEPQCRKRLERETIRQLVSKDSLKIYDKKLAFATMARNPNFRWCRCGHGQIHEPGEASPDWKCVSCNERHCFICRDEEESNMLLCEHLQQIDRDRLVQILHEEVERKRVASEEKARQRRLAFQAVDKLTHQVRENTAGTQNVITTTTKRCPRLGCRAPIQRDQGCAHMTCRNCRTEFCWACKVIWNLGTYGGRTGVVIPIHLTTCPLAASRTIIKGEMNTRSYARNWDVDRGYNLRLDTGLWLQADQR